MSRLSTIPPFQCFLLNGADSVVVNFGTVICPTTNGLNNIFVPTIAGSPMLRFREEGFSTRNKLNIPSENSVICLKINFQNIEEMVLDHTSLWEGAALNGSQRSLNNMINRSMSLELQRDFFNDFIDTSQSVENLDFSDRAFLSYASACELNPIVSISPIVNSVSIVSQSFTNFSDEELDQKYTTISSDGSFYKLCPIAVVRNSVITQLIDFDYVFTFPFYWLDSLKEPFTYVPE